MVGEKHLHVNLADACGSSLVVFIHLLYHDWPTRCDNSVCYTCHQDIAVYFHHFLRPKGVRNMNM